ncbi:MAG TPA: sulfite exporter TauE/SafE family protein [Patescibacteria group bacterium]
MKNKITVPISGMHCRSCEILVEENLLEIPDVERSVVNYKKGTAEVHFKDREPNMREIEKAIREAGYSIGTNGKKPLLSKNPEDYKDLGIALIFLVGIYIILKNLGFSGINPGNISNPSSLGVVLLVGLTAGVSSCMALVGGLILGISARHAEKHPEATPAQKFRPHLFFNLGRIGGYALLGGLLGMIGSAVQFSGGTLGLLTIAVGVVMLMLGMKLIGIFPRMENGGLTLPKSVAKFFGIKKDTREYSHRSSMITGALTFFLPCGFTQAMQLYAVSTGSFMRGALIMGVFALGTAPGLLGVGGLTSVVKGIFAQRFFKFAGILVIFLAMFNIANGYNLTGWQVAPGAPLASQASDSNVKLENGVQVVSMTESSRGYAPNSFTVRKGVPVRWEIDAQDPYSCASSLIMNKMGIRKTLVSGKNVVEFTPTETGKIPFSCSMGMYTGSFTVVDENGNGSGVSQGSNYAPSSSPSGTCGGGAATANGPATSSCGGSGGGCGGCGGAARQVTPTQGTTQTTQAANSASAQVVNTIYTYSQDIQPNTFKVKAGQPVKFIVDVKENGVGCMSTIMIPGLYNQPQQLIAGNKIEMDFTPTKPGTYQITCAMGVPRGTLTVE